eukprot:TRINITY_DN14528_c0_g1_i2.p1 TRINITY_DN14528_c0_g1~~TRINITY_DN14528_c0_g1_i2.p1  ORF type:complete len:285 (+),score=30.53 TRINITY_DN14528_c0_g1_i2:25-855(+)
MSDLLFLLRHAFSTQEIVSPRMYIGANGEILALTMLISGLITIAFNPERLVDNPIHRMMGYSNPCVLWDDPPALYVAWVLFLPTVYFAIRFAVEDTKRAFLKENLQQRDKIVVLIINWTYACSQSLALGIFVVTPEDETLFSLRLHSFCFVQLVPILAFTRLLNCWEAVSEGVQVTKRQWIVAAIFGISSLSETILLSVAVFLYKGDAQPIVPPRIGQVIDWSWFASLSLSGSLLPQDFAVKVDTSLIHNTEVQSIGDVVTIGLVQNEIAGVDLSS